MASFTLYAGLILGTFFSYHLFVILNSPYACSLLFGIESGGLVSHRTANIFFALSNLLSGIGSYFIVEPEDKESAANMISILTLIKTFFTNKVYKRATLWMLFSCFGVLALRSIVLLSLIKKGMRREHIVMLLAINAVFSLTNNFVLKRFMIPGQIIRVCSFFIIMYLGVIYLDWYNVVTFDPSINYNRGLVIYFLGIFLESACPWMSYHIGFVTATTYEKHAASYATTLMGVVNIGKIIPISLAVTLLDYSNYTLLFVTLNTMNVFFIAFTFNTWAKDIDMTPISKYHMAIEQASASVRLDDMVPDKEMDDLNKDDKPKVINN